MAHWPKSVGGNALAVVLALMVVMTVVQLAIALSGPFTWASLAVVLLVTAVLITWRRRVAAAHELAIADAPSFGDVLPHWNRHDDLEMPAR